MLSFYIHQICVRTNCCLHKTHDNAVIESFHSSLTSELFYSQEKQLHSTSTLKKLIHDYIEYYDRERIQEKLNYLSSIEYKKQVA
ncbi:IS3 family transposase [Bacillus thuringiensis]